MKRAIIRGSAPGARTYIPAGEPYLAVGETILHNVSASLAMNVGPSKYPYRPKKPKSSEYFGVSWWPSDNAKVKAVVKIGDRVFRPYECKDDHQVSYCSFIFEKADLTQRAEVLFYSPKKAPAIYSLESPVAQTFFEMKRTYKLVGLKELGKEEANDLRRLHEIDESIPLTMLEETVEKHGAEFNK